LFCFPVLQFCKRNLIAFLFLFFFPFIHMCNVWVISPSYHQPPSLSPPPPRIQAETVLPLSLILLKRDYKQ
jgi:hypothetical protein